MREKDPEMAVAKAALKPASKICPMSFFTPGLTPDGIVDKFIDWLPCQKEECAWWDHVNGCCCIKTLILK